MWCQTCSADRCEPRSLSRIGIIATYAWHLPCAYGNDVRNDIVTATTKHSSSSSSSTNSSSSSSRRRRSSRSFQALTELPRFKARCFGALFGPNRATKALGSSLPSLGRQQGFRALGFRGSRPRVMARPPPSGPPLNGVSSQTHQG